MSRGWDRRESERRWRGREKSLVCINDNGYYAAECKRGVDIFDGVMRISNVSLLGKRGV